MNDFEKGLVEGHTYSGYMGHFKGLYQFLGLFEFLLIAFSAVCSTPFYASALAGLGEGGFLLGALLATFVGASVFILHKKATAYYSAHGTLEPVLGTLLVAGIGLSFYADFKGAPQWGEKIVGTAPADARTAELGGIYTPQIEAINKEIESIESAKFYWCGTHNIAHKCASAQFYIDPVHDKKHVAKIEALKAQRAELQGTMNTLLSDAGKHHNEQVSRYTEKLEGTEGFMRGGSIVALCLFLLVAHWRHTYGRRAVSEIKGRTETATASNEPAKHAAHGVGVRPRRAVYRPQRNTAGAEAEKAYSELVSDMPELQEETKAMIEKAKEETRRLGKR